MYNEESGGTNSCLETVKEGRQPTLDRGTEVSFRPLCVKDFSHPPVAPASPPAFVALAALNPELFQGPDCIVLGKTQFIGLSTLLRKSPLSLRDFFLKNICVNSHLWLYDCMFSNSFCFCVLIFLPSSLSLSLSLKGFLRRRNRCM